MPPMSSSPIGQNISFGPKRVEKRQEQTAIEKLSLALLVVVLLGTVGVYAYRFYLQNTLTRIQTEISSAREQYPLSMYNEVVAFDRRIRAARYLLANRLEPSRVFTELETTVSRSIFYQTFEAQLDESRSLTLTLGGVSPKFAQVVGQSAAYENTSLLSNVTVGGLEIREVDGGRDVLFSVDARVAGEVLLSTAPYTASRAMQESAATAAAAAAQRAATSTQTETE